MAEHSSNLRASDADRAQIAERLRRANDEGRLLEDEFEERLGQALSARTYGELDAIVADLPCRDVIRRSDRLQEILNHRPRPLAQTAAAARRLATALRRPVGPVARTVAAVGASAGIAAALGISLTTTSPVVSHHRSRVVAVVPATCDVNGTNVPCHITNNNGDAVQHNARIRLDRHPRASKGAQK